MNKEVLAGKAGYKRVTYYLHVRKPDLPDDILFKYGKVLHHDFSEDIPSMSKQVLDEPDVEYNKLPKTVQEAKKQTDYWKQKYYELLDKYVKMIEGGKK